MSIARPYLMFLGDAADQLAAKTAQGVKDWRTDGRALIERETWLARRSRHGRSP